MAVFRANLDLIAAHGPEAKLRPQQAFCMTRFDMPAEFRDTVWDLRTQVDGRFVPLDFLAAPSSELNADFIAGLQYPDAEILDFLVHGADLKLDTMGYDTVLFPPLTSLRHGFASVDIEAARQRDAGYHDIFDAPPFWPVWACPTGATPRQYEPDRWRPLTDGGAPRYVLHGNGYRIFSINHHVDLRQGRKGPASHDPSTWKWPAEVKPTPADKI